MIRSLKWLNAHLVAEFGDDAEPQSLALGNADELEAFVAPHHPPTDVLRHFGNTYLLAETAVVIDTVCEMKCLKDIIWMHDWIDADRWLLAAGFLIIAEGDSGHLYLDLQTGKVLFMDPEVSGIAFVRGGPELDSICPDGVRHTLLEMLTEEEDDIRLVDSLDRLDLIFEACLNDLGFEHPYSWPEIIDEYSC